MTEEERQGEGLTADRSAKLLPLRVVARTWLNPTADVEVLPSCNGNGGVPGRGKNGWGEGQALFGGSKFGIPGRCGMTGNPHASFRC